MPRILLYGKGTENRTRVGGLKVRYFTTKLCPQNLAGDQGFEPRNAGIKIRCLRPTWRIPNVWWTVRESNSQSRLAKPMLSHLTNSPVERVGRVELRIIGLEGRWTPLVLSTRIEIGSPTWARTTDQQINSLLLYRLSYWGIYLEHRVRFELTTLRICNPLHLTTLPPVHKAY